MMSLRVRGDRIWAVDAGAGVFVLRDELALADGAAITISGETDSGELTTIALTDTGELKTAAAQRGDWEVFQAGDWNVGIKGSVSLDWSAPGYSNFVAPIFGQPGIDGGAGETTDKTVRVVIASDSSISVTALTDAELRASPVPVSVSSSALPTGAATAANQATEISALAAILATIDDGIAVTGTFWQATQPVSIAAVVHVDDNGGLLSIDDGGGSITVDGTVAVSGSVTVTGALTDTQLRASAVPVSLATLPNSSNLDVALSTRLKAADTLAGVTTVGAVTSITNVVHVDDNAGTLSIDDGGGSLTVDGAVTVSGTVAVTASALPLGAATDTLQTTGNTSLASILTALTGLLIAQGASASSQVGILNQAEVSDTPESYTPNTVQPLSITPDGRLRVSSVASDIENCWHSLDGGSAWSQSNPYSSRENLYV